MSVNVLCHGFSARNFIDKLDCCKDHHQNILMLSWKCQCCSNKNGKRISNESQHFAQLELHKSVQLNLLSLNPEMFWLTRVDILDISNYSIVSKCLLKVITRLGGFRMTRTLRPFNSACTRTGYIRCRLQKSTATRAIYLIGLFYSPQRAL